ncbi:MAG: methyltransferase [Bacteroidetes bacterium]|nr:methyltransferase [Bacteroidota bacterium]
MKSKIASPSQVTYDKAAYSTAPTYDQDSSSATQRLRNIMLGTFKRYFQKGQYLLELNSCVGTDAVALTRYGCRVHATSVSPETMKVVESRIGKHYPDSTITTGVLPLDDLGRLGGYSFKGAYSNFGGLNSVNNLWGIVQDLGELVTPKGYVILCFMAGSSLWQMIALLARARFREAIRRRPTSEVLASAQGQLIRTYYHSPQKVAKAFESRFECVEVGGLNIFTPPPSSRGAYEVLGRAVRLLEMLDDLLFRVAPFSRWGLHFYIVLKRV